MDSDGFELVDEIAGQLVPGRWMLVGGLMVHAHARLAGVPNARVTHDADIVVELDAVGRYQEAAEGLVRLGFQPYESLDVRTPAYRFTRGSHQVDLMAPDRTATRRHLGRPVLQVPGADSALKRTEAFATAAGSVVRIPDLCGALSLKGAAYGLPSAQQVRHLQDGVVLLACIDVRGVEPPSKSMRANINRLLTALEASPEAWSLASDDTIRRAIRAVRRHVRQGWTPPPFAFSQRYPDVIRRKGSAG